jgi:hypothetical protein
MIEMEKLGTLVWFGLVAGVCCSCTIELDFVFFLSALFFPD